MALWYLSFADPERPEGTQFLGAVMTFQADFEAAVRWTRKRGINPGGEVAAWELRDGAPFLEQYLDRLLSKNDLQEMARALGQDDTLSQLGSDNEMRDSMAGMVCAEHNRGD